MKMQDVRAKAKNLGISSFGKKKVELIREIQLKEENFDCYGRATDFCDQSNCCFMSTCLEDSRRLTK